jgi:hypothetical protein
LGIELMSLKVSRDFDTDEIVLRIKRGGEAGGFARFLTASADAIEHGKITGNPKGNPVKVADSLRSIADKMHRHNDA